jgi:2,3-bisphosphoglycerate-independent phosphoglycerate mutase
MSKTTPVNILMILDGWGINENTFGNAVAQADTPFLDFLTDHFPNSRLLCSGEAVGLPQGTMGNSEVGHMNIGAGRNVFQSFVRINRAIEDRSFFRIQALCDIMDRAVSKGKSIHLMGLLSDGGVHSHISHLFALIDMAKHKSAENVFIHPILDGRDTSPTSGADYITRLEKYCARKKCGRIASIVGRYWAMDRDTRWDRVEKAYRLFTNAEGKISDSPVKAVHQSYEAGTTDEFFEPVFIETGGINKKKAVIGDGDAVIFFNFRADRAREITRAFTQTDFAEFKRDRKIDLAGFVCMTMYDENFDLPVAFPPLHLDNILGQTLSQNNIAQLRIAETEKFAHVTYFFNGGDEKIFKGEERILIPSPRDVATYDEKPEMSALKIAQTACEKIESGCFQFIVLNFANMDMVGHTGVLKAAVKACETVDRCVEKVVKAIWDTGGTAIITADHGNSEQMIADDGSPHTAHTLNPVRMILAGHDYKNTDLENGILGDIAPTVLKILNIEKPADMTGKCLI